MSHTIYKLTAFPKETHGGNKAGVVINADNLSKQEKQHMAAQIGFSETAFVSKSEVADFKLEFFTPSDEVDLCGHATIATFNLLRDLKIIELGHYTQETKAGILSLDVQEEFVFMTQNNPVFSKQVPIHEVSDCFFGDVKVNPELPLMIVSTGIREIFLPIINQKELDLLAPNFTEIVNISKKYDVIGIHAFALDQEVDAYSRNFAPIVAIPEESATGTSNGALSCYLYQYHHKKKTYILRQGYSMNMPSEIIGKLDIEGEEIAKVQVGGSAMILREE